MGESIDTRLFWGIEFNEDEVLDDYFGQDLDELASEVGLTHVRLGDTYKGLTGDFITVQECYQETWRWGAIESPRPPTELERNRMVEFLNSILDTETPEDTQPVLILGHIVC